MATLAPARRLTRERWFFSGTALVMAGLVLAGFAPSYFLRGIVAPTAPVLPMTPLVHVHGVLFTAWILLFVLQTQLVARGRTDLHRALGPVAFAMLPAMIVIAVLSGLYGALRAAGPPFIPPMTFLAVPLFGVLAFAVPIGAALAYRRQPQVHKRLMFIAMTSMMSPATGRLFTEPPLAGPIAIFGIPNLFLVALAAFDIWTIGRLHQATVWGGLFLVATEAVTLAVMGTAPWLAFARWVTGLVA
jgi:hypothetical protein